MIILYYWSCEKCYKIDFISILCFESSRINKKLMLNLTVDLFLNFADLKFFPENHTTVTDSIGICKVFINLNILYSRTLRMSLKTIQQLKTSREFVRFSKL